MLADGLYVRKGWKDTNVLAVGNSAVALEVCGICKHEFHWDRTGWICTSSLFSSDLCICVSLKSVHFVANVRLCTLTGLHAAMKKHHRDSVW